MRTRRFASEGAEKDSNRHVVSVPAFILPRACRARSPVRHDLVLEPSFVSVAVDTNGVSTDDHARGQECARDDSHWGPEKESNRLVTVFRPSLCRARASLVLNDLVLEPSFVSVAVDTNGVSTDDHARGQECARDDSHRGAEKESNRLVNSVPVFTLPRACIPRSGMTSFSSLRSSRLPSTRTESPRTITRAASNAHATLRI